MKTRSVEDIYPLSPLQEGMLFHGLCAPGSGLYVEQACCLLRGRLHAGAMEEAWRGVVERHPALRISVLREGVERPLQVVHRGVTPAWTHDDWRGCGREEQARRLEAFLEEDRVRGFEPSRPPLLRFALIRLDETEWQFVWTFHHVLLDGWSASLVLDEVVTRYAALVRGLEPRLPPVPPYRDYIAWLASQDSASAREFWRRSLAGIASPPRLPLDRPRAARLGEPSGVENSLGERTLTLPESLAGGLQALCRRQRLTLGTVFQGAVAILLARLCGAEDVLFGNTVSGRPAELPGVESMVGLFINTLPIRASVPPAARVLDWLGELQRWGAEARQHESVSLVDVQGWSDVPRGESLFETLLVFENYPESESSEADLAAADLEMIRGRSFERTNYPLTVMVDPGPPLTVRMAFDRSRFEEATIERMLSRMETLLGSLAALSESPHTRLADLPLMKEDERRRLLVEWNDTTAAFPCDRSIASLFEEQARRAPDAVAVVLGDTQVTYGELDRRANRIAARLRARGVGTETAVGLCAGRSIELIAALLGIVKAGGAWVPLDPSYPKERLALMIEDAGVRIVLLHGSLAGRLPDGGIRTVPLDGPEGVGSTPEDGEGEATPPAPAVSSGENLACIFHTSGSTGRPKGVGVPHRAIARLVTNPGYVTLGAGETLLQLASISFDASLFEIWGALLTGGRLVVTAPGAPSLEELGRQIERHGVTTLWLTAPLFHQMVDGPVQTLRGVRQLLAGGDVLSPGHVRRALAALPNTTLINGYGPTEGTTFSCCHVVSREAAEGLPIPIGRPIPNTRVFILDRTLRPVPTGIAGELYIGGEGLARGYVADPALTAEKFIPDPFSMGRVPGGRLYRTGDLARWSADGIVEFLGRADHQIKIRGYRVEPGEVEAALAKHPLVKDVVVAAREEALGGRRLIAWIVPRREGDEALRTRAATELRAFLGQRLPDYMVPGAFVFLDEMPRTPAGKLDRARLPDPDAPRAGGGESSPPRTPVEDLLAGLWARLLRVERVGIHDDFFDLGGHSLVATQLVSRVRETFGVEIPLRAVFEAPTVAGLAARVEAALSGDRRLAAAPAPVPPIQPVPRDGPPPLSFAQQRLWFLDQFEPGSSFYNIPVALRLKGRLDTAGLERSLAEIVRRHEALRTTFSVRDGVPVQIIGDPAGFRLEIVDLRAGEDGLDRTGGIEKTTEPIRRAGPLDPLVRSLILEEAQAPFDLERGPLIRARLLRLAPDEHALLVTMHHIVSDGWSIGLLVRELAALYDAFSNGRPSPLPELPIQYADFAVRQREWLRGDVLDRQLEFWKGRLEGAPPALALPTDRPRPAVQTFRGSQVECPIEPRLSRSLRALARGEDVTLFMLLLAAFQTLLHRHAGQDDVVVGVPVANRTRSEIEGLIGFFVNTLPVRTGFAADPLFRDLVAGVRRSTLDAWAHQDLPFEQLVEALQPPRDPSRAPVFQAMLVMDNAALEDLVLPGLEMTPLPSENVTAKLDLTLTVAPAEDEGLTAAFEYNSDLFDPATIEALAARFRTLLEGIVADPDRRVSELPILTGEEERRVLIEWNDTRAEHEDAGLCLHELIDRRAAMTPDAVAVRFEAASLSNAALRRRADALALRLVSIGVGPDVAVAVCMERSLEMIVALLGILKAGGAYLPLDPEHPPARLAFQMKDAGCPLVLSQPHLSARLPEGGPTPIFLEGSDRDADPTSGAVRPTSAVVGPGNLAYVIYTSGSTGAPKGVMIPHSGIVNRLLWMQAQYGLTPADRVLQKTPFTFDVSVWEFFWPLIAGAQLVLARPGGHREAGYLAGVIAGQGITTIHFVPSMLEPFLREDDLPRPGPLARVFSSGEALRPDLQERWFQRVGAPLHNLYGPTEVSVDATSWRCRRDEALRSVPIGRPIANTRAFVLDRRMRPVPPGSVGELHLGGVGLARGYLNRPDLTAERFVPDPFVPPGDRGGRLYRTGDLARFLPDGTLEYLGRMDQQVKIRGVRIEPGEIEAALLEHPGVRESAVVVHEDDVAGARLVGYVVAEGDPEPGTIRAFLRTRLPEAMIPSAIVGLPRMPRSSSGKVDRRALPAPDGGRQDGTKPFVAPRTAVEEALARFWSEILGVARVGVTDSLFDLGGHSLLATRIHHRVREAFRVELSLRDLFEDATVEAQARAVVAAETAPGLSERIATILNRIEGMSPQALREALQRREETKGPA